MDKNQVDLDTAVDAGQTDWSQQNEAPPEFGGKRRYCMRCGKRFATHIKLGSRGTRQYRCDECFEGRKKV